MSLQVGMDANVKPYESSFQFLMQFAVACIFDFFEVEIVTQVGDAMAGNEVLTTVFNMPLQSHRKV